MICFDIDRDLVLIDNSRVIDLKQLKYVSDKVVLESLQNTFTQVINEEVGLTLQGLDWLAQKAGSLVSWGIPKLFEYIKKFLPDTIEGWIHLGVDVISLIFDILGPFTAGIGNVASIVIDVLHGIYYIGAATNLPGFPNRKDKEFEYLLSGLITLGFAAVPIGGNAGSLGFKTFLKANPIKPGQEAKWLVKIFESNIGKNIVKVCNWMVKNIGSLGRYFFSLFEKVTKIPIVGKIFGMFGNLLKTGIAYMANTLDTLMLKLLNKKGIKEVMEKYIPGYNSYLKKYATEVGKYNHYAVEKGAISKAGAAGQKDFIEQQAKGLGKKGAKDLSKKELKATKELYKDELKKIPAYVSISRKMKMMVSQLVAEKTNFTKNVLAIWSLLFSKISDKDLAFPKLKENGVDVDNYSKWYLKYAFFIDEEDREDDELSKSDIEKIQNYLVEYSSTYDNQDVPKVTGTLDAKTVAATRRLFQYLIDQDTSELEGDDKDNAEELKKFCKDGLNELNVLDKNFFTSLQDKISPKNESYLYDFDTFDI